MDIQLENRTLDRFFDAVVRRFSKRPSIAEVGQTPISYAELGRRVATLRQTLQTVGIQKGDKVIVLGYSSPAWGIAYLAITTMGAVAVPIMEGFPEVDIDHIIRHSEAVGICISNTLYRNLNLHALEDIPVIINMDEGTLLPEGTTPENFSERLKHLPSRVRKAFQKSRHIGTPEAVQEEDLAEILYTSGTTGHSKGVMLTHKNLVNNLIAGPKMIPEVNEEGVILSILPMAHAFGCTCLFLSPMYRGASIYFLKRKPTPKILMEAMQRVRPTVMGAVPLVFEKIYHKQVLPMVSKNKTLRLLHETSVGSKVLYKLIGRKIYKMLGGRLECAIIGGASLNTEVELFLRSAGIPYALGYGLSECSPLVSFARVSEAKVGSVGRAVMNTEIRIVEPDPHTGVGEIFVRGDSVMKAYYKNEAETRKVLSKDGWLITGDRGYLDEEGYLYIRGRSKNIIVGPSGENIYPEAIEDKIMESPCVEEVLVYQLSGQLVARIYPDYAYIESSKTNESEQDIAANIDRILEEIKTQVNAKLPPASRIQQVLLQTEPFVKTPTNKIKRAEYVPNYLAHPGDRVY